MELVWCLCSAGVDLDGRGGGLEVQPGRKLKAGDWADAAVLVESGFLVPYAGHRYSAGILGQTMQA